MGREDQAKALDYDCLAINSQDPNIAHLGSNFLDYPSFDLLRIPRSPFDPKLYLLDFIKYPRQAPYDSSHNTPPQAARRVARSSALSQGLAGSLKHMLGLASHKNSEKALTQKMHKPEAADTSRIMNSPKDTGFGLTVQAVLQLCYNLKLHALLGRRPIAAELETMLSTSREQ